MIPIHYNVRSLFVRKATTIATVLGVGLVVFVLATSQMLANGISRTMGRSGALDRAFVLRQGADAELSSSLESRLVGLVKATPGVKKGPDGAPLGVGELAVVIALDLADRPEQVSNVLVRGTAIEDVFRFRADARITEGRAPKPGTNEVVIGRGLVGRFRGLGVGATFELNKNRPAQVVGVFDASGSSFESEIWVDIDTARAAFGRPALVSSITVALDSAAAYDGVKATIEQDKQLGLQVTRESEYYEKQSEGTRDFVTGMGAAIVFFFSVGAMIGAMITMYAAVANRGREIGTLRALGFSRAQVLLSFVIEAGLLTLLGGVVGVVASLGMTFVKFSMMNFQTWSQVTFGFEPTPTILASALAAGGLMGLIGGLLPAIHAARLSPLAAMRD
ncbi:MAG: ABC transporter permease [Deltaproteobacteria bacterium]|nr:ABC transporter permease [Deltaproteobacteria bacterium]